MERQAERAVIANAWSKSTVMMSRSPCVPLLPLRRDTLRCLQLLVTIRNGIG